MLLTDVALRRVPQLKRVRAPERSLALSQALRDAHARVDADPERFDGAMLMCASASLGAIEFYAASYAWSLVHWQTARGGVSALGLGPLGSALVIYDERARALWSRRAAGVDMPGRWGVSANGGVDLGESPYEAALREAREELSLAPDDLRGLAPARLLVGDHVGVMVVFRAALARHARVRSQASEVAGVRWAADPAEVGELTPTSLAIWRSLQG